MNNCCMTAIYTIVPDYYKFCHGSKCKVAISKVTVCLDEGIYIRIYEKLLPESIYVGYNAHCIYKVAIFIHAAHFVYLRQFLLAPQ